MNNILQVIIKLSKLFVNMIIVQYFYAKNVVLYFDNDYFLFKYRCLDKYKIHRSLDTSLLSSHLSDDVQMCATVDHMSDRDLFSEKRHVAIVVFFTDHDNHIYICTHTQRLMLD